MEYVDIPSTGIEVVRRILEIASRDQCCISISADGCTYTAMFLPYERYLHEEGRPAVRLTVDRSDR